MPQLDKQLKTNTGTLEQYIEDLHQKEKHKKRESQLLLLLFMLGLLGLYCVCQFTQPTTPNYSDYNIQWKDISAASVKGSPGVRSVNLFANNSSHNETLNTMQTLQIRGEKEAHLPVVFTVDSFDEAARYILDFGNGKTKVLNSKRCAYIYRKAGQYEVKLYVEYKGQRQNIYSGKLRIGSSIEIADGAEIEI